MSAAVDGCGIEVVARHGGEGLPHEEDGESVCAPGDGECGVGIVPVEFRDDEVVGDEHGFERDHHGCDEDDEEELFAGEFESCEGVACGDGGNDDAEGYAGGDDKSVEEVTTERCGVHGVGVVVPLRRFWDEVELCCAGFLECHKGGSDHPREGEQSDEGSGDEQAIEEEIFHEE